MHGQHGFVTDVLEKKLIHSTQAPLKPQLRIYALINHMIPGLFYPLTFMAASKKFLKSLDTRIWTACRKWLRMPKDVPKLFFHASSKMGGLGLPQLQYKILLLKLASMNNFLKNLDSASSEIISNNALPKMSKNWEKPLEISGETAMNKEELDNAMTSLLYWSVDGKGSHQTIEAEQNWAWINNGTLLLNGRDCIGCRGNYLCTGLRALRGITNASPLCECCSRIEDLSHILQSCPRTLQQKSARHNRIRDILASKIRSKN